MTITDREFLQKIGVEIRIARFRKRVTQDELERISKVAHSTIGAMEKGKNDFHILVLKRIAEALEMDVKDLL